MSPSTGTGPLRDAGADRDQDLEAMVARGHVMASLFGDEDRHRCLGRYRLHRLLGRGAHGQVFEAFDPELNRRVAIKVVHGGQGDDDADQVRDGRIREARALARLDHPNVVDVYDVGVHDGSVFVVMELVDGDDLARFASATRPSLAELVTVFVAAGRGLAAAHQVGLVHRDFKPSNVLVGANVVKVADFGLARVSRPSTVDDVATDTSSHAGTPIYMPPEQFRAQTLSAASDQYAFCVALWEQASGELPFDGLSPTALLLAKEQGLDRRIPERLPPRLGAVLRRGLSAEPRARYRSMDALLAAIERSVAKPRRARVVGLSLAAVAVVLGGVSVVGAMSPQTCDLAEFSPLQGSLHAQLSERLSATALSTGETQRLVAKAQAYATHWERARDSACIESSEPDVHVAVCLDKAAVELEATLSGLVETGSDAALVTHAGPAIDGLPDPKACLRLVKSQAHPSTPAMTEVTRALARARALHRLGQPDASLLQAQSAQEHAADLDAGTQARVSWELGRTYSSLGRDIESDKHLAAAFYSAREASLPVLAVQAATSLADSNLARNDFETTEQWLRHAEAALVLIEGDAFARVGVLRSRANVLLARNEFTQARDLLDEALALSSGDGLDAAPVYFTRAQINEKLGELESAETDFRRALVIDRDRLGAEHPELIPGHAMLGMVLIGLQRHALAKVEVDAAMTLGQRWLPPQSADMARLHESVGLAAFARGEAAMAADSHARALQIRRAVLPDQHPAIAFSLHNAGLAADSLGRFTDAVRFHQEAVERLEPMLGANNDPEFAELLTAWAEALRGAGRSVEAVPILRRAEAILSASAAHASEAAEVTATLSDALVEVQSRQ